MGQWRGENTRPEQKGLTCEADTLGSCGYVYLAVYPTPETKK